MLLPDGRRVTKSAPLKGTVAAWATEEERRIRRGERSDPSSVRHTVGSWVALWSGSRIVEPETERGDRPGLERIEQGLGRLALGTLTRMTVQQWVRRLDDEGVGPHAVRRAYNCLATAMNAAVDEGLIVASPCRRIALPPTPEPLPAWYTPEQVASIVAVIGEPHATMTLAMCWLGLRWGECAGLRGVDVDVERRRVRVIGAMSQSGEWREYPKTAKSRRELPAPAWLVERLPAGEGLLFTTRRQGRPMSGSNWRTVWDAAVTSAGVPAHSPHSCRHTAATWLVQRGASLYDVQTFLGHEDPKTTMRYAHHAPDAAGRIERIWETIAHPVRTDDDPSP